MLVLVPITVNSNMAHDSPSRNMNPANNASSLQESLDDNGNFLPIWLPLRA